ncbi:hypothetical protein Agabi119p4_4155 [Agaricus bisporus var. burnettii]|uniref:Uncharacterized protein n=1 Tax=Agaricus bisporus var. burnettii TaxID=192524 RepID=A0A8H7F2R9_AGABI|nr:hypothetical protein Agabi119p4_4155 [Agaricus bisporus var. burnettii]
MNHIDLSPYTDYNAYDNGAHSVAQGHPRQHKHPRQNHNSHDTWLHSYHHDVGSTSTTIFKDYASVYSSQPQSINPTLILDPSYETAPISQEYAYASTIQPTMQIKHNAHYAVPRGISPSSSDSSIRSVDSWPSHNVSSRSSPASSISSRHLSPMPELHLPPPKHPNKSSHLRVQTGSASIRPSIVSPRHAKRVTPYQDFSEGSGYNEAN